MARNYHVFDIIILGGGPAGLAALQEALLHTSNVALISEHITDRLQGIYAHRLFPFIAQMAQARRREKEWEPVDDVEMTQMLNAVLAEEQKLHSEADVIMQPYNPYRIEGSGKFASPFSLRVDGRLLHFRSAIIATGAGGAEVPWPFPEKTSSGYRLSVDAFYPWQCSFGVMMSALGMAVEIRHPRSCYGVSRHHFSKWKNLLPPFCRLLSELPAEKAAPLSLPSGMGLRAAGISKALWLETRENTFRLGDSRIFVAGEAAGTGKDAFACAEEGRMAVRQALGVTGETHVPRHYFTLYGLPSLAVYGEALRTLEKDSVEEKTRQTAGFSGRESDCRISLWMDKTRDVPLRGEIIAFDTVPAEAYLREWMRTGKRPALSAQEIAASPALGVMASFS